MNTLCGHMIPCRSGDKDPRRPNDVTNYAVVYEIYEVYEKSCDM